jgi:5'(3')-deoxyribonucleotidase
MKKPVLGIDCDDVLNNLITKWLELYNHDYNDNLTKTDVTDWNTSKFVKPECGKKIFDYLLTDGLFDRMVTPPPFAVETTKFLVNHFEVYIVSSCMPETFLPKVNFIKQYYPHINPNNFIACHDKYLINADYLIDDYHENLRNFRGNKILMNAPYNQNIDFEDEVIRVNNWVDIYQWFRQEVEDIKKNLSLAVEIRF